MILHGAAIKLLDDLLGVPKDEQDSMKKVEKEVTQYYEKDEEQYKTRRSRLYPGAPDSPTIPFALPLKEYAGDYHNVGYGSFTFKVENQEDGSERLSCQWERTWPTIMWLEHVNAETWFATTTSPDSPMKKAAKAQSKVGANGKVEGFSIAMEPTMPDTLMWFARSP